MRKYGRDWIKASEFIGTKSNSQIRNYAHHLKENLIKNKNQENCDLLEILNRQKIVKVKKERNRKRESWTESEKSKFNWSLRTYGKDW